VRMLLGMLVAWLGWSTAHAADVYLESRRLGFEKIPVVVLPFSGSAGQEQARLVETILQADLARSHLFEIVDLQKTFPPDTPPGRVASLSGALVAVSALLSADGEKRVLSGFAHEAAQAEPAVGVKLSGDAQSIRQIAHRFADKLVSHFTGEPGVAQTKIAYVSDQTGKKEVYMMDYDGANETRLTGDRSIVVSPRWSHDAEALTYTSYRSGNPDVYLLNMNTAQRKVLIAYPGINLSPSWLPSGEQMVFSSTKTGDAEIYTMRPDGGGLKRLTFSDANDLSPSWAPSGRQIAFTSDRGGSPQIYVMDADGSNVRRLTFSGVYNTSPAWSPKGDRVAYACRNDEKRLKICLIDAAGQGMAQITDNGSYDDESPSWAPSGQDIVFASNRMGKGQIFSIHADGTSLIRLTASDANHTAPAWSPR